MAKRRGNTEDFKRAAEANKSGKSASKGGPKTKAEADRLEKQRAAPRKDLQLTPEGNVQKTISQEHENQRERRISEIKQSLGRRRRKARDDFDRSR